MTAGEALEQQAYAEKAIGHLKMARDLLKKADAPRAVEKVRRALKSAEGAVRNTSCRKWRTDGEENAQLELQTPIHPDALATLQLLRVPARQ